MSCRLERKGGRVFAVLTFSREQLLYDIKNYAYIEGHIMEAENEHQRHSVQDVGEEGNVDRITRVLDLSVAQCKELLYPFVKHRIHENVLDDEIRDTPVYGIRLELPNDFSQTTLNLLELLIHEYMVSKTMADWLSITNPNKAEVWVMKMREAEEEIRTSLHSRVMRSRRKLHPF